jgi:hypothetical protein
LTLDSWLFFLQAGGPAGRYLSRSWAISASSLSRPGHPLGEPGQPEEQRAVLEAALRMLEDRTLRPPGLLDYSA